MTGVAGNLWSFLKEVKPLVLYDVEHGIAKEPMKGKWASSRVDVGYSELLCSREVTAEFPVSAQAPSGGHRSGRLLELHTGGASHSTTHPPLPPP